MNDILDQAATQNVPGILLQLDFKMAFDTIEWKFIQKTLARFNFGDSIQRWISTLNTNPENSVVNNGFCTNPFQLSRGVRRGCLLSPISLSSGCGNLGMRDKAKQSNTRYSDFFKRVKLLSQPENGQEGER